MATKKAQMQVTAAELDLQKELGLKLANSVEKAERNMDFTNLELTKWLSDKLISLKKTEGDWGMDLLYSTGKQFHLDSFGR